MAKTWWRALPALLLAITSPSCSSSSREYLDPDSAFSLHYPGDWTSAREAGGVVFAPAGPGPRPSLVITRVAKKEGRIIRTEASFKENTMVQFRALPAFSQLRAKLTTLAGQDAQLVSISFQHRERPYRKDHYVISLRDHFFVVDCNAPEDMFDDKLFSQLLATLEVSR